MRRGINVLELPADLQRSIGRNQPKAIPRKVVVLGKVLSLFKGMNRRDARWVLRHASKEL